MANIKISNLNPVTSLNSQDVLPTVDTGVNPGSPNTYKVTVKNIANSLPQVSSSISASYASNAGVSSIAAGTGVSVNSSTGNVTITVPTATTSSFPIAFISGSSLVSAYSRSLGIANSLRDVILGREAGVGLPFGTQDCVIIGTDAASGSTAGTIYERSVFLGAGAGSNMSGYGFNTVMIGYNAGRRSTAPDSSVIIGDSAGQESYAGLINAIGYEAFYQGTGSVNTLIGYQAGKQLKSPGVYGLGSNYSVGIGASVYLRSRDAFRSVAIGNGAGADAYRPQWGVIIGDDAGSIVSESLYCNMIGSFAGRRMSGSHNNFIGSSAGERATGVDFSNFIGYTAGYSGSNSKYSNFIGYQAGFRITSSAVLPLSDNNTIIGTNLTLPNGYGNYINLGGALFVSGTYGTTSGFPFSGSVGGSRVGINVVNPTYNLDVSGSGNFTNNVTITGSLTISGSALPELRVIGDVSITGSLVVSGSNGAGVFSQGATFIDYTSGISTIGSYTVWRAPFSCSVVALYGYYTGGSSAQINAARSGSSGYGTITGSNVILNQDSAWIPATGSGLRNKDFNTGDVLQVIMTGSANFQLAVQVDFIRKF